MALVRTFLVLAMAFAAPCAFATVLYKSLSPTGVVQFSDTPPGPDATIVEQRLVDSSTRDGDGLPFTPMEAIADDEAVARAAARVDLAEHALALARRGLWSASEGLRLRAPARSLADQQRVEFYKREVLAARKAMLATVKQRMAAAVAGSTQIAAR